TDQTILLIQGGRGGGGYGGGGYRDKGPPSEVVEVASFLHACEGDVVIKLTHEKIPYFNAPIYLQNKTQIGKVWPLAGWQAIVSLCKYWVLLPRGIGNWCYFGLQIPSWLGG
ncbi:hypothetical protein IFM89_023622, partial [Coptis chinensis]